MGMEGLISHAQTGITGEYELDKQRSPLVEEQSELRRQNRVQHP